MALFIKQVGFAVAGIKIFFYNERNGKIQACIALAAIVLGSVLQIKKPEWCIVILCIAIVLGAEMVNTALEKLCNLVSSEYHPAIKVIKDVSAGAVLLCSVMAAIVGLLIFVPYLYYLVQQRA